MLDKDLAELYGVTTGNLNKAVKRNIKRFPDGFLFQLKQEAFDILLFQFGIANWGGTRPMIHDEESIEIILFLSCNQDFHDLLTC